jgi:RHH-type transcriptional regulator, rel operon repressor / antitoxin RelB
MAKDTITFRIDADKKAALDTLATAMDRDRSYLLNEALAAYLDMHAWQIEHVKEGLRQADAGEFATEDEVAAALARWRR